MDILKEKCIFQISKNNSSSKWLILSTCKSSDISIQYFLQKRILMSTKIYLLRVLNVSLEYNDSKIV